MNAILAWLPAIVLLTCAVAEGVARGATEGVRKFAFGTPTSVTRVGFTKVTVKDRQIWLCCPGCKEKLISDPDTYLAKLEN